MGLDGAVDAAADEHELAARRVELERDFQAKARELKAQEKRRLERLKKDQAEWDEAKRAKAKELADRTEKLRRQAENATREAALKASERQELGALKVEVRELEKTRREAASAQALEADLKRRLDAAQVLLAWSSGLAVLGALFWLAANWFLTRRTSVVLAAIFLAAAVLVNFRRMKQKH